MKTKLFFLMTLLTFGLMNINTINAQVIVEGDLSDWGRGYYSTSAQVSSIDALLIINFLDGEVNSLDVLLSGARANVTNLGSTTGSLAEFAVSGLSPVLGQISMTIIFTVVEDPVATAAGLQKNRRVEMEVVFE